MNSNSSVSLFAMIIAIVAMIVVVGCYNGASSDVWNNGVCTKCDQRYVVVKARGSINWYTCQGCGQELSRFVW